MAENTIDNLSIQVTASAESATRVFDRLASGMGRVRSASQGAAGGMEDAANAAEDMGTATATAGTESGNAAPKVRNLGKDAKTAGDKAKKGASGLRTFWESLKRIAFYRFVRSIIKSITEAFSTGITNLYHWSDALGGHFAKNMDRLATSTQYLKNGLGTLVAPLIEAVIPAIDWLIDRIVDGINYINMFFAAISGKSTYTAAKKVAAVWDDSSKKVASSTKKASDDIKRTILGFDEINKLVKQNESSGSSGSSSGKKQPNYRAMFEERPLTGGFKGFSNAIENALSNTLSRIGLIVSGASLAVGAILTFSGANIPLGLSLMAAGAAGLVSIVGMNWNGLSADIKLAIGAVEAVVGGSLLAFGAVLAFSGVNPALGIAMMAAGAVSIAAAVGLNWGLITGKVKASAKGVIGAISAAAIALGAILAFSGVNVPLGVGLLAAGVTGAAAVLNWDWLQNVLRGKVAAITAIISGSLLAIGAILAFSGVAVPLGIGMIAVGAVGLAATAKSNWDIIVSKLRCPIGLATALISGASLMLGILAIVGGHIPLGIGLIIAGAAGLATTAKVNWDTITNRLRGPIGTATALISGASLVLGVLAIIGGMIPLGIGLILLGAAGLATTVSANWNAITDKLRGPIGKVTALISGAKLVLGILAIIGGMVPLGIGLILAGAAGLAASVAANWDKLETLGKTAIGAVKKGWDSIKLGVNALVSLVKDGWETVSDWAASFGNDAIDLVVTIKEHVSEWFKSFINWLTGGGEEVKVQGPAWGEADITVNAIEGNGVKYTWDGFMPIVDDTESNTTVNAKPGKGIIAAYAKSLQLGDVKTNDASVTVNAKGGKGFKSAGGSVGGGHSLNLAPIPQAAATVLVTAKSVWDSVTGGITKYLGINKLSTNVSVGVNPIWALISGGILGLMNLLNLKTDVYVDAKTAWDGKTSFLDYLKLNNVKTDISVGVKKGWTGSVKNKLGLDNLTASVKVGLRKASGSAIHFTASSSGGVITFRKGGGVFANGRWSDIPQYAGGTTNAGSLFVAGEAGPEVVGHIGGRTEVLNKSQLASAVYSAVQAAMAPAAANFAAAAQSMATTDGGMDMTMLAEMIRVGMEQAMGRQNELDRQRNDLLRSINEKDFNQEISTASINKAQQRMNRRAGTTIVPVGT